MCKNPNLKGQPSACASSIKVAQHLISAYAAHTGQTYDRTLERLVGSFKVDRGISLAHMARRHRMDVLSAAALRPEVLSSFVLMVQEYLAFEINNPE